MITLVTGQPARSGKSEWAENLALSANKPVIYIATAQEDPKDLEWQTRIEQHRQRRPNHWQLLEIPIELPKTLTSLDPNSFILIDAVGTWVSNLLEQPQWEEQSQNLLNALQQSQAEIAIVAEEVGWGLVPPYPLGRLFRDRMGNLVRAISKISDRVVLVVAGYAVDLSQVGIAL